MSQKPYFSKKVFAVFLLLFFLVSSSKAAIKTWAGGTGINLNWLLATNWLPSGIPAAGDDIVFNTAGTMIFTNAPGTNISYNSIKVNTGTVTLIAIGTRTFTVGGNTGADLVISNGASLTIGTSLNITLASNATATIDGTLIINSGRTFNTNNSGVVSTVTGSLINYGTVSCTNAGRLLMQNGSVYTHARNGGSIPVATWAASSTCNITGVTSTLPGGLIQSFGNFTWNASGQSANINLSGDISVVAGSFRVSDTNGRELRLTDGTNLTMTVGDDFIIENGSDLVISSGDNAAVTINIAGNYLQDSGIMDFFTGTTGSNTLNNTFEVNVAGNFTLSGDGLLDFAAGKSNVSGYTKLNIGGDLSQSGSSAILTSTSDQDISNGTITFNKSGTQACSLVPANVLYVNFAVASGAVLQLNSNVILSSIAVDAWGGKFTVNNGGTLDAGTNQLLSSATTGFYNAFIMNSGGTLKTANTNGILNGTSGTISDELSAVSLSTAANYKFSGTGSQVTAGMPSSVSSIEINNAAGVVLSAATTVSASSAPLILTNGILTGATLTISSAYTGAGGGGSATSHVNAAMAKTGNTDYEFPVGNGTLYRPVSVSALSGSATITARYFQANPKTAFGTALGSGVVHIGVCEYWTLDDGPATITAKVGLQFGASCNGNQYVNDPPTLLVAHWNGTQWENLGNDGSATMTSVKSNSASGFSPFTVGSNSLFNPLPVKIGAINAYKMQNGVQVDWTAYSETDIFEYIIERSADGVHFNDAGSVAARNSGNENQYGFFDPVPLTGLRFYRLRIVNRRNETDYSNIVRIDPDNENTTITIYPNPAKSGGYISFHSPVIEKGLVTIRVSGIEGKQLYVQQFNHAGGPVSRVIALPASCKPGQYFLQVESNGLKKSSRSFIIQ